MPDTCPQPAPDLPAADGSTVPAFPRPLLVAWVVAVAVAVVLGVGVGPEAPEHPTPVSLPNAYRLLVGVELFLLLFVAPLAWLGERGRAGGMGPLLVLLATALPAVVATAWAADVRVASVVASQGYLVLAAIFAAAYGCFDARGQWRAVYGAVLGGLGAGAPLVGFVAGDLFRLPLTWVYALSPFCVADRLCGHWAFDGHWAIPTAALLAASGLLALLARRLPS
ncbi:hypothetical protein HQ576_18510 [bacterium]|nr:hypothetical protein [bacterium]